MVPFSVVPHELFVLLQIIYIYLLCSYVDTIAIWTTVLLQTCMVLSTCDSGTF